ncbi:MAG: DUF192 domain-containing protein [Acidimicrobiales bacterium]
MKSNASSGRRPTRPLLMALLGWSIVLTLVFGVSALLAVGANEPADPRLAPVGTSAPAEAPVEFGKVAFRVTPGSGAALPATTERCALLADTEQQHQRGLMGRSDLGGFDAMVFRFVGDTSGAFFMRNVPIALSIAWFDAGGRLVSTADMVPCPDEEGCPQYPPAGPYRFAVEVEKGGLGRLGIAKDSVLRLGGDCSRP